MPEKDDHDEEDDKTHDEVDREMMITIGRCRPTLILSSIGLGCLERTLGQKHSLVMPYSLTKMQL